MGKAPDSFPLTRSKGFRVLLTAGEGYPAFERLLLDARREVWASFRVFDPQTRLRSPEARRVGKTWADLIAHVLRRGVRVRLAISDFDPAGAPEVHRLTWRSVRLLAAVREMAGEQADLDVVAALHPARAGLLPRLVSWPVMRRKLAKSAAWLNGLTESERARALAEMPGLAQRLATRADGRLHAPWWPIPDFFPATHHQKIAVIDRKRLYVGGLDLNERRYDTRAHDCPGPETWQDVQLILEGPAVAEAQAHLESFIAVTAGRASPRPTRHLLRTISARRPVNLLHFGPRPVVTEILEAHVELARRSERLIYLETQFLRDVKLARALARAGRENPRLGMIVMLPGAPEDVAFASSGGMDARLGEWLQARCLKILRRAFGGRLFVGAGAQPCTAAPERDGDGPRCTLHGAPLVYIHSKVSIFDTRAAIVSSANLNGRSLRWDTEAGVLLRGPRDVDHLRRRVFSHWLPEGAGDAFFDPARAVGAWRALALENAKRVPEARRGFVLPFDFEATERWGAPLPLVPDEMV